MAISLSSMGSYSAWGQQRATGEVRSSDGTPLPGATIRLKGSRIITSADGQGRFNIQVRPGDTLIIGNMGYQPMEVIYRAQPLLKLVMKQGEQELTQVVVVGYGSEQKRHITGSIASVSQKELEQSPALSFDNAISGRAAGVDVLSSSGMPGSATAITIRGISTLNSDGNQPLIVIDGIPVYGSGQGLNSNNYNASTTPMIGFGGTHVSDNLTPTSDFENNPLSKINPADIASIDILKDAYATSIYGSRGAAGVILITTKKGNKGKPAFNVRYITGTLAPIAKPNLLSGSEYRQVYTDYYKEVGQPATFFDTDASNWLEAVTRTAVTHDADISMGTGGDKSQYYISGGYSSQPSYIIHNDYSRYTGRMNFSYQFSDKLSAGSSMSMTYTNNTALNAPEIYREAILKAPNLPIQNEDGTYNYGKAPNSFGDDDVNPVADATLNTNKLETNQSMANIYLEFKPFRVLSLRSEFGTEYNTGDAYTRRVKRPSGFGDDAVQTNTHNRKLVVNNTATLMHTFSGKHYVNAVVGQSFEKSSESVTSLGGYGFLNDDINSLIAAENHYVKQSLTQRWALISYFSRVNYEWADKYLAGISYRLDGSSKFSRNKRYVGFPSFSAGWRISEERFLQARNWIDDIKIRASIGFSGNNSPTSYYGNQGQYTISSDIPSYAGTPVLVMEQPDNPNLKWEKTRSADIGLDMTLFNGRLSMTADYYDRLINNMIVSSAIPLYQGWSIQPQNIGKMKNYGIELTAEGQPITGKNLQWSMRFNISRNMNKLLALNMDGEEVGLASDAYKFLKVGEPVGLFYLYDWAGIDPYTGDPQWRYPDGSMNNKPPASLFANSTIDVNDYRKVFGSSSPIFFGGLGNNLRWKGLELDAFFSFSYGGKMINGSRASLLTYTTTEANNLSAEILQHWTTAGQVTNVPRLANSSILAGGSSGSIYDYTTSRTNSRFLESASYLRLRTISLSYHLSKELLDHMPEAIFKNVQLFIRASNLFTVTGYSGLDPEVSAFGSSAIQAGYDELTMPQTKMYQIGVNIGF